MVPLPAQSRVSPGILLAAALAQSIAEVQYLQHSGWIVRTAEHVLVFDYVENLPSGVPLPAALRLSAESFDRRRVIVFVSHAHADHLSPVIAAWFQKRPDIQYVLGSPEGLLPGAKVMRPRETWQSGEVVVSTTGSTDQGVGFLVTVDGVTLYHAGDLARWSESDDQAFMNEIRWLEEREQPIDIAFLPIATGAACDPRPSIWDGVRAAASLLAPRILMPMHVGCADRLDLYARFREEIGSQLPRTKVVSPSRLGESFRYQAGTMAAAPSGAGSLKFDLNRAINEAVAHMLATPRFQETIEVRDPPQEALEAHVRAANLQCGATAAGPPSYDEMNRFRETKRPPTADLLAAGKLLHRKLKGLFASTKPRYFLYSVQRTATPGRAVYVVRDGPVPEDARWSVPGTTWDLITSFADRRTAAEALERLQRGSAAPDAPGTLWAATACGR